MEGKQGVIKGMDQDVAFTKRDPNSYFEAHNFRVVTDAGSSSGSLENEKGTVLSFLIPDLAELILSNGTVIPAQADLKIIGSCTMVDEIIIFTTNSNDLAPNSYGQIWKCKYDEGINSIIGLTPSFELDPTIHLFYNQKLNFSTEYRIGRAIALYENENKQRVYWTDNYNQVRTFNLATVSPLDTALATIDLFPGALLPQPVFVGYGSGNLLSANQIQFTYRLLNTGGGESAYAPPTPLIPLPDKTVVANSFATWNGEGQSNNKSVTYSITGIDTAYDVIEHIAIIYDANNTAVDIYKFAEDTIPATGNLTVICTTVAGATVIPIEEYAIIEKGFDKCKDIEVQGNRLVAANLSTDVNDLKFDARAYRFNSPTTKYAPETPVLPLASAPTAPIALLQDTNDNNNDVVLIGGGATPLWDSVPEDHDSKNIFNTEQEVNWFSPDQTYKYKADGVTLGGQGKNISYEFTTIQMTGNNSFGVTLNAPNRITAPSFQVNEPPKFKGELLFDGTPKPISVNNQIANMAGPWAPMNYTGYARGEVYRFGIVLYDKKGIPSFVEWIGDIKFPDVSDGYPLQTFFNGQAILNQLGIKFTVDVSSIADKISGYAIVRLERADQDRTKIGTGFFMHFNAQLPNTATSLMHRWYISGLGLGGGSPNNDPFPVTGQYNNLGDDNFFGIHLSDRPGKTPLLSTDIYNRIGYMISPFGSIYNSNHTANDYIETLEYYSAELRNYYSGPTGTGGTDSASGFFYKMKQSKLPSHDNERIQVEKSKNMYTGEVIKKDDSFLDSLNSVLTKKDVLNTSYTREPAVGISGVKELHPLGIGYPRRVFTLHTPSITAGSTNIPPTLPHMDYQLPQWENVAEPGTFTNWYGEGTGGSVHTLDFNGTQATTKDVTFKSIGYRRYLDLQYGGASYENRSTDQYIYIGHHQITETPAAQVLTTEVYGGDVYVNYYDEEYLESYVNAIQNPQAIFKPSNVNRLSVAACGPVETPINTNWRIGKNWAKDRDATFMDSYAQNGTLIYKVWNKEDDIQNKFFSEDFLSQFSSEHPAQLWASSPKINGELVDSWRNFPIANKRDVDGIYGPINRILSFKENLLYYQDRAFGVAALDEKSVIQDNTGQSLVLGSGGVFPDYKYISTNTGSIHQFSVVNSEQAVYHYDARLKKFFRYSGGIEPLSDMKGMSSFFAREVIGDVTTTDKTLRAINPLGIHGTYDPRYGRVLYTFLTDGISKPIGFYLTKNGDYVFPAGAYVTQGSVTYFVTTSFTIPGTVPPTSPGLSNYEEVIRKSPHFTIGFNEMLGAFESFYDYHPGMYLEYGRRLLSVNPAAPNEMHTHNIGPYGQYYDNIYSTSKLHTVFAAHGDVNKVWNNLAYQGELYDENNVDIYDATLNRLRFKNNYQDTGVIGLTPNGNIKRRMRTWRTQIPREMDKELSRMRNPWLECLVEYDNYAGYRHVLHDLIYSFTPASM